MPAKGLVNSAIHIAKSRECECEVFCPIFSATDIAFLDYCFSKNVICKNETLSLWLMPEGVKLCLLVEN